MKIPLTDTEKLRAKHKKEIETLQATCKHKKLSGNMEEQWAPAHGTGRWVKVCYNCGKIVKIRGINEKTRSK